MKRSLDFLSLVIGLLAVLPLSGAQVSAQSRTPQPTGGAPEEPVSSTDLPPRPSIRPVFGEAPLRPGSRHALDGNLSLLEAFDNNLAPGLPAEQIPYGQSGNFETATASLTYRGRLGKSNVGAVAAGAFQFYPESVGGTDRNHNFGASIETPWGQHTLIEAEQTFSYATYFTLMGLPGSDIARPNEFAPGLELLGANPVFGVDSTSSWSRRSFVSLQHQFDRRTTLSTQYGITLNDFPIGRTNLQEAGVRYTRSYTRDVGLRLGYIVNRAGLAGLANPLIFHTFDVGVNYQRALSRTRRTTFSLATGSSYVAVAGREFRLLVDAELIHLSGQSWTTTVGYNRGVQYMGVLSDLVSTDTVTTAVNGFLTRSLETSVAGQYSKGDLQGGTQNTLTSYSAVADLRYGLSRSFALTGQYAYFVYDFGANSPLGAEFPTELQRHSLRGGVVVFLPFVR